VTKRRGRPTDADDARRDGASELDAFAAEMRDVVRLQQDPRGRVRSAPRISPPRDAPPESVPIDAAEGDFVAHGVDHREIRKLKHRKYEPGARCDLHGMTVAEARAAVERLIARSRERRYRCICIIHGRGLHSTGNPPILKTRVREYLRSHRSVLAYADAPASDGGPGAVYVLLRK